MMLKIISDEVNELIFVESRDVVVSLTTTSALFKTIYYVLDNIVILQKIHGGHILLFFINIYLLYILNNTISKFMIIIRILDMRITQL